MPDLEEVVLPDGSVRKLGNRTPPAGLAKAWPVYGDTPDAPMVARSGWPALVAAMPPGPAFSFLPYVHDQDGVGQCNCDDTAAAIESCRMSQGLPFVKLSAADLYGRINGGADGGSMLEDAMHEVMTRGIGTAETAGLIWRRGQRYADDAERGRFRVLEAFLCPTFDHCMSAALCGFRLSSGIMWFGNYTPDADGWLPSGRGRAGGHAVFGFKPAARQTTRGVGYGIWHRQSWGTGWAPRTDNCFVIPEAAYEDGQVGGWWALRSVVDEGGIIPIPSGEDTGEFTPEGN